MTTLPKLTIGIEEEYMLVDLQTKELASQVPSEMMPALKAKLGDQVSPEFLQCQVEIGTKVCGSIAETRDNLAYLRRSVSAVVKNYGYGIIAASTHPFSQPSEQHRTQKARYEALANDLQGVVQRLLISGMHVHVGLPDDDCRVDLMGQAAYILPHLLALSTSSPFWRGKDTGLKSYRMAVWDEMPRTGLPPYFESYSEYRRHVDVLVHAGIIEDGTKVWWDLRLSDRYPTLEMRIPDLCTTIDDAVALASLYACWLSMLYRLRSKNLRWRRYSLMLLNENRWRAHRYGTDEGLIDFGKGDIVPYDELLEEILELVEQDAIALNCVNEVNHARTIVKRGSSAHRQLAVYYKAVAEGDSEEQALKKVVAWLLEETLADTG